MVKVLFAVFLILHGLVHLLYFGQSYRFFELQQGMVWPDGSWAFARLLGDQNTRLLTSAALVVTAIIFVIGGVGVLAEQGWWRTPFVVAAVLSSVLYVLMWDGTTKHLDNQGGVGVLINVALLLAVLVFRWPAFAF